MEILLSKLKKNTSLWLLKLIDMLAGFSFLDLRMDCRKVLEEPMKHEASTSSMSSVSNTKAWRQLPVDDSIHHAKQESAFL